MMTIFRKKQQHKNPEPVSGMALKIRNRKLPHLLAKGGSDKI
jgi:hypothetical protein